MKQKLLFAVFLTAALFTTTATALTFETVEPAQEMVTEQEQAALAATSGVYGNLTYRIYGSEVWITRCDTSAASVTIPKIIDGYPVTCIDWKAFYGCTGLTSVTIPDSVTSIGEQAFRHCTNLTSVTLGNGLTSIGGSAFSGCTGLTSITIPDSVTSIGDYAFCGCTGLTSVIIPDSVTSIGDSAFARCTDLTSIIIGNGVTSIGEQAFWFCTSLTSITLGKSVTSIGQEAFEYCSNLSFVDILDLDAWCKIDFANSLATPLYYGAALYVNGVKPTEVILSDGVTSLKNTFRNLKSLKSITIPDSVTSIGYYAFYGCDGLTSITIPDSVTSIGNRAFEDCTGLTSVTIGNSLISIGESAFENCTGLTSVTLGNNVTSIGNSAFDRCTSLTSITIPSSVTSIGESAFSSTLSSVYIYDLSAWCKISLASTPFCYGTHFLYLNDTLVEQLILPSGISTVSAYTFANISGIKSVVIPKDVKLISQYAFDGCNSITEIYYTGTAAEWERVRIANHNGSLSTATVYTDYVPMKITFSANTTDEVSSLPNETSAVGAYVLPSTVPVRSGYNFLGWSTAPNGKATYQPGDTVEICAATTFYAVWKKTLLGDIDGNDTVDLDDAILLFQHSMLPELYPISYAGNVDFNKDGTVDIDDAVLLFQYSMLPDLYPLE